MRIANLSGRLAVVTGDPGHEVAHDAEKNSGGRFGADPPAVYEAWDSFAEWAAGQRWRDHGIPVSPDANPLAGPAGGVTKGSARWHCTA